MAIKRETPNMSATPKRPTHKGCTSYLIRNIPAELFKKFQEQAQARGLNARTSLILLMEESVNEKKGE